MGSRETSLADVARAEGDGWCAFIRGATRGECVLTAAGSLGMAGEPFSDMNSGIVFDPVGAAGTLRLFVARLRARGLPGMISVLSVAAAEASAAAADLGLARGEVLPLMCARAADAHRVEHDYDVGRVRDAAGLAAAATVLGDAYEIPSEWCLDMLGESFPRLTEADVFVTSRDGRALAVVGTARIGSTVGVYAVGTRHAHRRRGAAAAALSAAMDHHVRAGAHLFSLLSAPAAEPLYAGMGFTAVDHPQVWLVEATD